ncbi:MAG: cytochrome c family protein [Planctomycetes bacterium]|nr:cytochrome c family protein [Planctomycetota bacterium]
MRKTLPSLALIGMLFVPVGLLLEALRDPAQVVIAAENHQLRFELRSEDGDASLWSVPGGVQGVYARAPADQLLSFDDGVVALRGEVLQTKAAVTSLKSVGAKEVRAAVLFDPREVAPAELRRETRLSTVVTDDARSVEISWTAPSGMFAACGAVRRIVGDPTRPPMIVALGPDDEEFASRIARDLADLLSLFPEDARDSVRAALPSQLVVSNSSDLDLADGDYERLLSNVWIGPSPSDSVTPFARLARLAAFGLLARDAHLPASTAALAAAAWADLATKAVRGRMPTRRRDALELQAYRAARTTNWELYADVSKLEGLEIDRLIGLVGPQASEALEARLASAERGTALGEALAAWLLRSPDRDELASLFDSNTVKATALERIAADSCIEPCETTGELQPGRIHWEFVGEHGGYLETCGCKSTEGGGIVDLVARWSDAPPIGTHRVLLGNELATPDRPAHVAGGNELILSAVGAMHLTAFVPGMLELSALASGDLDPERLAELPIVCCNVVDRGSGAPLFDAYLDLPSEHGLPATRVIGVAGNGLRHSAPFVREPVEAVFAFLDVAKEASAAIASAPPQMEIVLVGDLIPSDLQRIARAAGRPILAISRELLVPRVTDGRVTRFQVDGRIGDVSVVFSSGAAYHLVGASFDPASGELETTIERLADRREDPEALTSFKQRIQQVLEREQPAIELSFTDPMLTPTQRYVGSESCKACHAREFAQWLSTPHASAMLTLEHVQRQRIRNCVACHVVGFEQESGYRFDAPSVELRNVGCEVCHGPGSEHVERGSAAIRRTPPDGLCASCHTEAHSNFLLSDPSSYRRKIDHSDSGAAR